MMAASGEAAFFYLALLRTSPLFINHALHLASIFGSLIISYTLLKSPIKALKLKYSCHSPRGICLIEALFFLALFKSPIEALKLKDSCHSGGICLINAAFFLALLNAQSKH